MGCEGAIGAIVERGLVDAKIEQSEGGRQELEK